MSERIKIKINKKDIKGIEKKACWALGMTAQTLQDEIREEMIIPRDKGTLQGEKFYIDDSGVSNGKVLLMHEGPYAHRLYHHPEYNFRRDQNPNAQALWFRPWEKGGIYEDRPAELFRNYLKKEL